MSTNSAIGEWDTPTHMQGRYCHSDGYPTHQGRALWTIVKRDGLDAAVDTLLYDHAGWSFLDPTREDWDSLKRDMHDLVPGYGLAYNDEPGEWVDPLQYEWSYIFDQLGMWICHGSDLMARVLWDGPEPDWETIEKKGWDT